MNNQNGTDGFNGQNQSNSGQSRKRNLQQISQRNNDDVNKLFGNNQNNNLDDLNYDGARFDDDQIIDDEKSAGIREEHI